MSITGQMFGLASSVTYIRCGGSGYNTQLVLESLASGFGASTGDGAYVYNLFNTNTGSGTFTNFGFDLSSQYYQHVESSVTGMGGFSKIGTATIIYSYATYPNIGESTVISFVNTFCQVTKMLLGEPGYQIDSSGIDYVLSQFSLTGINSTLTGAPVVSTATAINYNWYDSTPLFINPNLDSTLIRDVENQYYYISGEIL